MLVGGPISTTNLAQIQDIETRIPVPLLGFDCDNGSEFLNWKLIHFWKEVFPGVHISRSFPYHKNDNRFVEQKNSTLVRQYLGYERLDSVAQVNLTNQLYDKLWLYNLHYFDDLNATGPEDRTDWHRALIDRWVGENPPFEGIGWDPYPTSLRIVNWIKWACRGNEMEPAWLESLAKSHQGQGAYTEAAISHLHIAAIMAKELSWKGWNRLWKSARI